MSLEQSQKYLHETIAEAKAQRHRRIVVGTPESNRAVLDALEARCRELLARNQPLEPATREALEATLDSLQTRWRRVPSDSTDSSSSTSTDTSTTTESCPDKDHDKKCKDHDHRGKNGRDCDDRKR